MKDVLLYGLTVFVAFFGISNPINKVPIILSIVKEVTDPRLERKVAFKSVLVAYVIVAIFSIAGHLIFKMFGITLPAFQIAGGLIIFVVGFNLVMQDSSIQKPHKKKGEQLATKIEDYAISPLGIPLITGPGTIAVAMGFIGENLTIENTIVVNIAFALICGITYFMMIYSKQLSKKLSPNLMVVISKVMGLILTVIAIQMIIKGTCVLIQQYHQLI